MLSPADHFTLKLPTVRTLYRSLPVLFATEYDGQEERRKMIEQVT